MCVCTISMSHYYCVCVCRKHKTPGRDELMKLSVTDSLYICKLVTTLLLSSATVPTSYEFVRAKVDSDTSASCMIATPIPTGDCVDRTLDFHFCLSTVNLAIGAPTPLNSFRNIWERSDLDTHVSPPSSMQSSNRKICPSHQSLRSAHADRFHLLVNPISSSLLHVFPIIMLNPQSIYIQPIIVFGTSGREVSSLRLW